MKNIISKLMVAAILLLSFTTAQAQIKNATTTSVKIYGNCGMCEKTIENAGNLKKVASVDWDKNTKMAEITFDSKKTTQDEILKRIALAGYDSDSFLAPTDVYDNLHGCCKYDREAKVTETITTPMVKVENNAVASSSKQPLSPVFQNYFDLKNALVSTDSDAASKNAATLLSSINDVKMDKLEMDVHMIWMKVIKDLKSDATMISQTKDIAKQRASFIMLSQNMYEMMKISKTETPIYYQHCPMANNGKGANWLSTESAVKNPYYGSQMLSCGKTVETIK